MMADQIEILSTCLFGLAILHTFSVKIFQHWARRFPEGSLSENLFHFLGEVEIVFGLWAAVFLGVMALAQGHMTAIEHLERTDFTEPAFVFVIMTIAATKPVIDWARNSIGFVARFLPLPRELRLYVATLTIGPLLGSFITEPAAIVVTAMVLRELFFSERISERFKYATLGLLFVNVSIGGAMTSYAAPPILMVAKTFNWDLGFMLVNFGWKVALATTLNALLFAAIFRGELQRNVDDAPVQPAAAPLWVQGIHLAFIVLVVLTAHHPVAFMGIFLFFLGFFTIAQEFQQELKLRQSLLVGFFLAGLVIFGGFQRWWIEPIIRNLTDLPLFLGTTVLTAFTDNAAVTYLGSQVPDISPSFQYALVAGAIAGGGLTVIANAPNPAGFSILQDRFGSEGISPLKLLVGALVPTLIGMACLWFLPSL